MIEQRAPTYRQRGLSQFALGRMGGAMAKFCNALTKYNHALQENLDWVV